MTNGFQPDHKHPIQLQHVGRYVLSSRGAIGRIVDFNIGSPYPVKVMRSESLGLYGGRTYEFEANGQYSDIFLHGTKIVWVYDCGFDPRAPSKQAAPITVSQAERLIRALETNNKEVSELKEAILKLNR
jgi:hypothetical protein